MTVSAVALPPGAFDVDAGGQATYRVEIEVPPGIGGAQPKLALGYAHSQPNGILGVGWGLSGLSTITRVKATYAVDGFNGAVSYGPDDRYALDGQRLINVEGDYGAAGTLYYTELQSWNHVRAGASALDGFTVVAKSGTVSEYGTTPDSRIMAAGGTGVRVWALSATTDLNGNRVEYGYTLDPGGGDPQSGAYYLARIAYSSRADGTAANRFVDFAYELRPDPIADYVGGYPATMLHRLTTVTVSVSGEVVRSYTVGYGTSVATELSVVETITQSGAGSAGAPALPPTRVGWQDVAQPSFDTGPPSTLAQRPSGQNDVRPMDVSGSGLTDLVQLWTDSQGNLCATVYLATPSAQGTTFVSAGNTVLGTFPAAQQVLPADVDGDGRTDLIVAYASGPSKELKLAVFLSDGSGFSDGGVFDTGDQWTSKHLSFFAMDANGDGRTDVVEAYAHHDAAQGDLLYMRSYLSEFGSGGTFSAGIVSPTGDPAYPSAQLEFWPLDVNGDGMVDLVRVWQAGDQTVRVTSYVSVSRSIEDVSFDTRVESNIGTLSLTDQVAFLPVDTNGDGVQDLLQIWQQPGSGTTTLHLTTFASNGAGGFVQGPDSAFPDQVLLPGSIYPMDLDGGGATAVVGMWTSGGKLMFTPYRASPSGRYRALPDFDAGTAGSATAWAAFLPSDVNGDGKADLLRLTLDQNRQVVAVPYASSGAYPDVVSSITNPLGGHVAIEYAPLTDSDVYTADNPAAFPAGTARRYPDPITPGVFPVQGVIGRAVYVVSGCSETNDATVNRFAYEVTRRFTYSGARVDLTGRGWQGFGERTTLAVETGRLTTDTYAQEFPYTGHPTATAVAATHVQGGDPRVPSGSPPLLMTLAESDYTSQTTGSVVQVLRTASRLTRYDYGEDHPDFTLAHSFGYDDYGNETLDANLGYVDPQTGQPLYPHEVVYRHRQYQNDVLADGWALGYLRYEKETANAADADVTRFLPGDYHLLERTYAATTYNALSEGRWDDRSGAFLTTAYGYDAFGNRTSEAKPGDQPTEYAFDPDYNAFLMGSTTPANEQGAALVVSYGYDPRFDVEVARTDANGHVWITALDPFGRVAARQAPRPGAGGATDANAVTPLVTGTAALRQAFEAAVVVTREERAYLDDGAGGLYLETQQLQAFPQDATRDWAWTREYADGRAHSRETVQESGQSAGDVVMLTDYDSNDRPALKSLPFFSTTPVVASAPHAVLTSYDVLGRPIVQQAPAGPDGDTIATTTWAYAEGGLVTKTSAAGSSSPYVEVAEHHYFDGKDCVAAVTVDPDGEAATTSFEFDAVARLLRATDPPTPTNPDGVANVIAYDSLDNRISLDNPDQNTTGSATTVATTYAFDAATGLIETQTDAAGEVTGYGFDGLRRPTSQTLPDGRTIERTYDDPSASNSAGLLSSVVVRDGGQAVQSQLDFDYDSWGNPTATKLTIAGEPAALATGAVFDPQRRWVEKVLPDGSAAARVYDFTRLVSQTLGDARVEYPLEQHSPSGKAGRLVSGEGSVSGGSVVTDYTFNPSGQVYGETVTGPTGTILDSSYSYDLLSQLLAVADTVAPDQAQSFSYENRRLKTASVAGFDAAAYDYDASGNLCSKDGVTYDYDGHFPAAGSAGGQQTYAATQDACGRTTTRTAGGQTLHFSYDGLGALARVATDGGAMVAEMVSDYEGRLLRKSAADGGVTLYVDPSYQVSRTSDGTETVTRYLLDDRGTAAELSGPIAAAAVLYFRRDFKGSNTHTFGADGTLVAQVAYDGYGRFRTVVGEAVDRSYEDRLWDGDFGLYYFGARWYDPVTGRFLTPDSQLGSSNLLRADALNRFAFELNNPINATDPDGHSGDWVVGLLIAIAAVAIGIAVIALTAGAATPFVAAGFVGFGVSAGVFSVTHRDVSGGRFWAGWVISGAVGAVVGVATAGAGSWLSGAAAPALEGVMSQGAQIGLRVGMWAGIGAVTTSAGDVFSQFMSNVVDDYVVGGSHGGVALDDGLARAAITGAIMGAAGGALQGGIEGKFTRVPRGGAAELDALNSVEMMPVRNYGAIEAPVAAELQAPRAIVLDTARTRLILFGVGTGSLIADAGLEAGGL